jgi:hypothetical protein
MAMRFTWLATLVLGLMVWNTSAVEARSRTEQTQAQSRTTGTQASRATTTRRATAARRSGSAQRPTVAQRPTGRTANRSAATRTGARRQQATATCRGRNCAPTRRAASWQAGLEPATNAQAQSCPVGTLATLARGHSDVVRCLPL